jgi:hypothetical protein
MIKEEKYKHAIYALHQIFVRGRFMAYTEMPYQDIAQLLDYAEIMPEFIACETDETEKFLGYLKSIVETFPNLRYILDTFNSEENPYGFLKQKQ